MEIDRRSARLKFAQIYTKSLNLVQVGELSNICFPDLPKAVDGFRRKVRDKAVRAVEYLNMYGAYIIAGER